MCGLQFPTSPNVIVGLEQADDAGVYKITDDIAMIQTVDFFTPIVDDPYQFGQIAAANALSDVYAMGGTPKTAMNIICFPLAKMDITVFRKIIQGGIDKMKEADVALVGGHSIEDSELKYGLSVTGFIHPEKILTKKNIKPGDKLVLTKPLGSGIINTAIKGGIAPPETIRKTTEMMMELNKKPAEIMNLFPVHACTDITGFGLLGHLAEMLDSQANSFHIWSKSVPYIREAFEYASMGLIPRGTYKNKSFREKQVEFSLPVDSIFQDILFDPQTSGGLLISIQNDCAEKLVKKLQDNGIKDAAIIGEVIDDKKGKIIVT